jgi:hypothetical protein
MLPVFLKKEVKKAKTGNFFRIEEIKNKQKIPIGFIMLFYKTK